MTLNSEMAVILRYLTEFGSVGGYNCVKVVEVRPIKMYAKNLSFR